MSILDKLIGAATPPESEEKRAAARAQARDAAEPGDWLCAILDHHEAVETAFAAVKAAETAAGRTKALKTLGALLNGHAMAEEAVVYPALADIGKMISADMAYAEQVAAKMQIAALETLDPLSEDFLDKLSHLEGAVGHHVYKEESEWFLELKEKAEPDAQTRVTERYLEEYERYIRGGEEGASPRRPSEERSFGERPLT